MMNCIDSWWGHSISKADNWYLVREVICDLLGASVYGYAFLYAWIMEVRDFSDLARLCHDKNGMLKVYKDYFDNEQIDASYIQKNFVNMASGDNSKTDVIFIYYRGKVLLDFLKKVVDKKGQDRYEKELHKQVEDWLEIFLDLICGINADFNHDESVLSRNTEIKFAEDFSSTVLSERIRNPYYDLKDFLEKKTKKKEKLYI